MPFVCEIWAHNFWACIRCAEQAMSHMQQAKRHVNKPSLCQREKLRAKVYMQDRRRLQKELDKTLGMTVTLQAQIDSIASSHVDMIIIDAMRNFNVNAARMSLPDRTAEVENLWEALTERQGEVTSMQEAMQAVAMTSTTTTITDTDEDLWQELEEMMMTNNAAATLPVPTQKVSNISLNDTTEEMLMIHGKSTPAAVASASDTRPIAAVAATTTNDVLEEKVAVIVEETCSSIQAAAAMLSA